MVFLAIYFHEHLGGINLFTFSPVHVSNNMQCSFLAIIPKLALVLFCFFLLLLSLSLNLMTATLRSAEGHQEGREHPLN